MAITKKESDSGAPNIINDAAALGENKETTGFFKGTSQNQEYHRPSDERTAPRITTMLNDYAMSSGLSSDAMAYVEEIRKILSDSARRRSVIEMKQLNQPNGSVLFYQGTVGIVLTFSEAIRGVDPAAPKASTNVTAAMACRRLMGDDFKLLNIVIVDRYSYDRAVHMANYISVNIEAVTDKNISEFVIDDLVKSRFTIDNEVTNVQRFLNDNSPHSIPTRADIGFTLNMKVENPDYNQMGPGQRRPDHYVPIMGCGAYVEIIKRADDYQGGTVRFQPIVHITEITSVIPMVKILPIIISVAADIFIVKGLWKNQFAYFEEDKPNLGNLIVHPETGKPWFAKSVKEREEFIQSYVDKPALAIDVVEGRCRIPGIEKYANPANAADIIRDYSDFIGLEIPMDNVPCKRVYSEIVGIVAQGSKRVDSRCVDYLTTVPYMQTNPRLVELLNRNNESMSRADLIQDIMSEFDRLYVNHVCIFNTQLIEALSSEIGRMLNLMVSFDTLNTIDMGYIDQQAGAFGSGIASVTSSMNQYNRNQFNPNWYNPGSIYGN